MSRNAEVWILVEGQTEEAFVKRILAPHLRAKAIYLKTQLTETRRARPQFDQPAYKGVLYLIVKSVTISCG